MCQRTLRTRTLQSRVREQGDWVCEGARRKGEKAKGRKAKGERAQGEKAKGRKGERAKGQEPRVCVHDFTT